MFFLVDGASFQKANMSCVYSSVSQGNLYSLSRPEVDNDIMITITVTTGPSQIYMNMYLMLTMIMYMHIKFPDTWGLGRYLHF